MLSIENRPACRRESAFTDATSITLYASLGFAILLYVLLLFILALTILAAIRMRTKIAWFCKSRTYAKLKD